MGAYLTILHYSIGSMFVGILLTIIGVALMFFLIRSWRKNATFAPLSLIVGAVLFVFLSAQSILLCGAITIKSYTDNVETYINELIKDVPDNTVFTTEDSQRVLDHINEEFPLVGYYLNWADFRGHTPQDLAESMVHEIRVWMNYFILRRVLWSLLFILLGTTGIICTMEKSRNTRRPSVRRSHHGGFYED